MQVDSCIDLALPLYSDVHKSQLRSKEIELQEQARLMNAKEKSIDSLRDTLATTKRTYESRLSNAESALSLKEAETVALREELRQCRHEFDVLRERMGNDAAGSAREISELHISLRARSEEATRLGAQLRAERDERVNALRAAEEMRKHVDVLNEELRGARNDLRMAKEHYELEIEDLKRKYKGEKSLRKGCEKWLRAELKGREEYDMLLRAIRETAATPVGGVGRLGALPPSLANIPGAGTEVSEVEMLLERLKHSEGIDSPSPERHVAPMALLSESERDKRSLAESNKQLKAELLAAKRLLHETKGLR
jgi:predicted  nucleic acid-binding Zn-ribbon protein